MAAFLEVQNLVKSFGSNTVVKGVNFAFDKGEFGEGFLGQELFVTEADKP